MKKSFLQILVILSVACLINCSEDDGPATRNQLPTPATFTIHDFGNAGDAKDLYVSFLKIPTESEVDNYQLILTKEGNSTGMNISAAASLNEDRKLIIAKTGFAIKQSISSQFLDSDGDPIVNGQSYNAFIYAQPTVPETLGSITSAVAITLEDQPYYEVTTLTTLPGMEALSYSPEGYLMIPGSQTNLYRVNTITGRHTTFDSGLNWPLGGGYDQNDGTYYAAMYGGGQVVRYDLDGTKSTIASGLQGPIGIVKDRDDNLYVANYDGNYISKIAPDGSKSVFADNRAGLINGPDGLVLVGSQLYSINFNDSRILKISSTGVVSLFATLPGTLTGYIAHIDGHFYVPSISERKVFKIDMNGNHQVFAGAGPDGGNDGPAMLATFSTPNGIAIGGDTIFVGDNNKVRMILKRE